MISGKDFTKILWAFFFVCIFFFCQGLGGLVALLLGMNGFPVEATLASALVAANISGILFFLAYWLIARPADLTWNAVERGCRQGRLIYRSGLCVLMAMPMIYLVNLLQELLPNLPDWVGNQNMIGLMRHPVGLAVVTVVGPICEELLFRGGVQRSLHRAFSPSVAIVCSALIFSIVHLNPVQVPAAFVLGLLLGFSYWWTRSLIAPICIHVVNNSVASMMALLSPDDDSLVHFIGGPTNAGITALICVFFLLILLHAVQKEGFKRA